MRTGDADPDSPERSDKYATLALAFSPDGTTLAVGGNQWLDVWGVKDFALHRSFAARAVRLNSLSYKTDNLIYGCSGGPLDAFDVSSGTRDERNGPEIAPSMQDSAAREVDGPHELILTDGGMSGQGCGVLNRRTGIHTLLDRKWIRSALWPERKRVVLASSDELSEFDPETGQIALLAKVTGSVRRESTILPIADDESILIANLNGGLFGTSVDVYAWSAAKGPSLERRFSLSSMDVFGVSRDGAFVLAFDPRRDIWLCDAHTGKSIVQMGTGGAFGGTYAFSEDHNLVALSTSLGTEVWDLKQLKRLAVLSHPGAPPTARP